MKALVVYESMFGNSRQVADAVADGLAARMTVDRYEVAAAPTTLDPEIDLLVIGGPTHALGLSRPETRVSAAEQAPQPLVSGGIGLREWLATVDPVGTPAAATFDTRVDKPRLPGSAARAARRRLRHRGIRRLLATESFYVTGTQGPLLPTELTRARQWGERLAATLCGPAVPAN